MNELTPNHPLEAAPPGIVETWYTMTGHFDWLFCRSFAGVVPLNGDSGTGRWPCVTSGSYLKRDGIDSQPGSDNRAVYEDTQMKRDGHWLLYRRRYLYLWLSYHALPGHTVPLGQELSS